MYEDAREHEPQTAWKTVCGPRWAANRLKVAVSWQPTYLAVIGCQSLSWADVGRQRRTCMHVYGRSPAVLKTAFLMSAYVRGRPYKMKSYELASADRR